MISLKDVSKWYGSFQVLTNCTTSIQKGEVVVVCGPSGSGKSTLIKCVNALEPFQKGDVVVDGISIADPKTNLPKLRARVGMVFQHFELFPHLSVTENLTIAQVKVLNRSKDDAEKRGLKMLDRVGLIENDEVVWKKVAAFAFALLVWRSQKHEEQRVIDHDHVRGEKPLACLLIKAARTLPAGFSRADVRFAADLDPNFRIGLDRQVAE